VVADLTADAAAVVADAVVGASGRYVASVEEVVEDRRKEPTVAHDAAGE
jgi:hypothetical protein